MKNTQEFEDLSGDQIVDLVAILVNNDCRFKMEQSFIGEWNATITFLGDKSESSPFWDEVETITSEF